MFPMNFNMDQMLPYGDQVRQAVERVISSGVFLNGPECDRFEEAYAEYTHQAHCVGVGSGLDALRIGLHALGVKPGDEVITTAFGPAYAALAIASIGAVPVFVDCHPNDLLLDDALIEKAVTYRTRAIIPVHLFGRTPTMYSLRGKADKHNLMVLEDAAQAHGVQSIGLYSHAVAWSFYPTKNLGALGEAGALTTNIASVAATARMLRDGGRSDRYLHRAVGINSRLDEIQAAVLSVKLQYLDDRIAARRVAAETYYELLRDIPEVQFAASSAMSWRDNNESTFHLLVIRVKDRDRLHDWLNAFDIPSLMHYPILVPEQPCFMAATPGGPWPVASAAAREVLSLPMHADITTGEIDRVCTAIREFYGR